MRRNGMLASAAAAWLACASLGFSADIYKLPKGSPELQSAGPLAFGPDGILLIGDPKGAAIVAIQTGDKTGNASAAKYDIAGLDAKIATALNAPKIVIKDLAVNPQTGNVFLSVMAGDAPAIAKLDSAGNITSVSLKDVPFSRASLPNAPEDKDVEQRGRTVNKRMDSVTDLAFVDGQVLVTGLSSAKSASNVRALAFPFTEADDGASLEIFHAAHGRVEDYAPIRTFVPFIIDGKPNVLAGFVCTPLVKFPIAALEGTEKVKGTTVAELGNRNQPLDMIVYKKDGKDYLLLANSARGVMKIDTDNLDREEGLTKPISGGGTAGQKYETVDSYAGAIQLDKLNETMAVVLVSADGSLNLKTLPLP